jgi:hypothetical protein
MHERADQNRTGDPGDVDDGPNIAAIPLPAIGCDIAGKYQHSPPDHDEACEVIDLRLPHATNDVVDVA